MKRARLHLHSETLRLLGVSELRSARGGQPDTQTTNTTTQTTQDDKHIGETEPYSFCGMCVPITAHSFCRC